MQDIHPLDGVPSTDGGLLGKGERLGVIGLFLFAFFALPSPEWSTLGLLLAFGAVVFSGSSRCLVRDPVFVASLAFAAYVVGSTVRGAIEAPAVAYSHTTEALMWLRVLFFISLAWILAGKQERLTWLLLLAAAGFLLRLFHDEDWLRLNDVLLRSTRTGFGYRPNPGGLYIATALLGLALFAPRLIAGSKSAMRHRTLRGALWAVLTCALFVAFIATQARSVWLAFVLIVPTMLLIQYRYLLAGMRKWSARRWILLTVAVGVLGSLTALGLMSVVQRTLTERQAIEQLLDGETGNVPRTPTSYRYDLYRFGVEKWSERLWFGWGPDGPRLLIAQSGRPQLMKNTAREGASPWRTLHNTYLEMLVRFGVIGTLLFAGVIWFLAHGMWLAYRRKTVQQEYLLLVAGAFGMTLIWSLFNYNVSKFDWQNYCILFAAIAYSFRLRATAYGS